MRDGVGGARVRQARRDAPQPLLGAAAAAKDHRVDRTFQPLAERIQRKTDDDGGARLTDRREPRRREHFPRHEVDDRDQRDDERRQQSVHDGPPENEAYVEHAVQHDRVRNGDRHRDLQGLEKTDYRDRPDRGSARQIDAELKGSTPRYPTSRPR